MLQIYIIVVMGIPRKISIGSNIMDSPWGGGNQFAINLKNYLILEGWKVIDNLKDNDIDIIIMTEPRKNLLSCKYNQKDIARYLVKKPDTIVVHRINECDERKETRNVNNYLKRANKVADFTVFVSNFVKTIFIDNGIINTDKYRVIRSGANKEIFNIDNRAKWNRKENIKLVTHHWSSNYFKGFDIYKFVNNLIGEDLDGIKLEFMYIGNVPKDLLLDKTNIVSPLKGRDLVKKIKENHIYLTASINEPAGNHFLEGASCGLPVLFRNSGGTPEYLDGYGVPFNGREDFLDKFKEFINSYDYFFNKIIDFPYNSKKTCIEYENLFKQLLELKKSFNLNQRRKNFLKIYLKEKFIYKPYKGDN
ncbi:MAG: glycosyltransferase [Actinobacteria bacterium]|nr:glycosyltransferase [Chloroflexota bacterium]MBE3128908.1 glycosyltransferase [Actinomycetota bacterium]